MKRFHETRFTAATLIALVVATLGPSGCAQPTESSTSEAMTTDATTVVLIDTSGSVLATDIPALAQNRLSSLVATMPVGSRTVLRGVNSNVTAMCQDLVITLPHGNQSIVKQTREMNEAAVPDRFKTYVGCSKQQDARRTEFWGGLAETYVLYPTAQVYAYSDTCETVAVRESCNATSLRDPAYPAKLVEQLAASQLVPKLKPGSTITFIGVGRNTRLRANEVAALRRIATRYAQRAGATAAFETK